MKELEFREFCEVANSIEEESSGNKITSIVANLLKKSDASAGICARFVQGKVFPKDSEKKLGMGPSLTYQAIAEASDKTSDEIEDMVAEKGDVGLVCENVSFSNSSKETLFEKNYSINEIFDKLDHLSDISGSGSQSEKVNVISSILSNSSSLEGKYLVRLILEEMRIGVGEGLVRDAISEAYSVDEDQVELALMAENDVEKIINIIIEEGEDGLKSVGIDVDKPIDPMLAKKGEVEEVIDDVSKNGFAFAEYKYDGARLQIHKDGDDVTLFTRNLENITESVPDVVESVKNNINLDKTIIDSEIVAYNEEEDEPLDFNEVLRRLRREENIEEYQDKVELKIKAFDIIMEGDNVLIDEKYTKRRNILESVCSEEIIGRKERVSSSKEVARLRSKAISSGNEGLIVKDPDSVYQPNNRGKNWMKIKPEAETLDCVVVGAEWGQGNRAGNFGSYILAVREENDLKTIGKVATGITEDMLDELTSRFKDLVINEKGQTVEFKPEIVFEVGYEEIQESPEYTSGYALRFPKFITLRETKDVEDSDSLSRVEDLI